jgi:hypothetical protein
LYSFIVPAIHEADASRQGGQHRHGQTDLDPARTGRRHATAKRQLSSLFDFHVPEVTPATIANAMGYSPHHNGLIFLAVWLNRSF